MNISILTIFPELFDNFWSCGIIKKAVSMKKLAYSVHSLRNFASGRHQITDDRPFGGGCGMVMKPEPIASAIQAIKKGRPYSSTIFLSPQGKKLNQMLVSQILALDEVILVCGRYEGIDERILDQHIDFEVSIGDYVLTGGELPAMVLVDAMVRLIPGVLGNPDSANNDTFSNGLIEYAQYTRPRVFDNQSVPIDLISGNHSAIEHWRFESSLIRTLLKRKDLLKSRCLTSKEVDILDKWRLEIENIIQKQSVCGVDPLSGP